jgi:hypothetical protein
MLVNNALTRILTRKVGDVINGGTTTPTTETPTNGTTPSNGTTTPAANSDFAKFTSRKNQNTNECQI